MNRRRAGVAALLTIAAACGARDNADADGVSRVSSTLSCGVSEPPVLTDSGIGDLRVGRTVQEIRAVCTVLADDSVPAAEGEQERRLTVVTGSVNTAAGIFQDRVRRILVESPRLRTADSLGVGSTVGELRQLAGARLAYGEGTFVLSRRHCGLSFELGPIPATTKARTLDAVPDSVRVERVLVVGCPD